MYGQHSWIAVLVLVAVMGMRMVSANRRRGGRNGGMSNAARGFFPSATSGPRGARPGAGEASRQAPTGDTGFTGTAPGWFADPFVRHEQRFWSGSAWTEHVQDQGRPAVDPPPPERRAS